MVHQLHEVRPNWSTLCWCWADSSSSPNDNHAAPSLSPFIAASESLPRSSSSCLRSSDWRSSSHWLYFFLFSALNLHYSRIWWTWAFILEKEKFIAEQSLLSSEANLWPMKLDLSLSFTTHTVVFYAGVQTTSFCFSRSVQQLWTGRIHTFGLWLSWTFCIGENSHIL